MGKLKLLSAEQVCKILSNHGFEKVRQKGSHIIMQKKTGDSTTTVPVPNHKEILIGTLKSIIRQSQIPAAEFKN
ncbi:MAG: putative periplasmic or secreted lipoprotein [Ignavibacteria bacterium]|nr:MAG: putative periplasmic or secreted lipoprotein [Ignavibacteria bacterium]KAF0162105.1 MAG: putative periplasmic or secreted lipoprotein [Ignavibacteria bacterium]